jgi:hypothetical protein
MLLQSTHNDVGPNKVKKLTFKIVVCLFFFFLEQNVGDSNTEVDSFLSMSTHESQSLFWERHIGLSQSFWKWATPILHQHFPQAKEQNWTPEQVYAAVNAVSPGFIRVEADELTYPLHVILRYQLEREILSGEMDLADLPDRWNTGMKEMLNVDVPSDTKGCLQDVHWSGLAIGYCKYTHSSCPFMFFIGILKEMDSSFWSLTHYILLQFSLFSFKQSLRIC